MTVPELTGLLSLFKELSVPASKFGNFFKQASDASGSVQRIDEFLAYVRMPKRARREPKSPGPTVSIALSSFAKGELKLHKLSFTYPGAQEPAFADISLRFSPGTFAIFEGPSGSGLTSLLLH